MTCRTHSSPNDSSPDPYRTSLKVLHPWTTEAAVSPEAISWPPPEGWRSWPGCLSACSGWTQGRWGAGSWQASPRGWCFGTTAGPQRAPAGSISEISSSVTVSSNISTAAGSLPAQLVEAGAHAGLVLGHTALNHVRATTREKSPSTSAFLCWGQAPSGWGSIDKRLGVTSVRFLAWFFNTIFVQVTNWAKCVSHIEVLVPPHPQRASVVVAFYLVKEFYSKS